MRFRVLVDDPADGTHNMALDEVLFRSALGSPGGATLRLYSFRSPTVSYGHRQRLDEAVSPEACRKLGIGWVRRPTGGRALLHQHELTYCVAAPAGGPFRGLSVRGIYDRVHDGIRRALGELEVPLDPRVPLARERGPEAPASLPCLAVPSRHELTSGGRKLVASAQRRSPKGFLQHGSILLRVDAGLWERIAPESARVPLEAVGLFDLIRREVARSLLVAALTRSFEEIFEGPGVPSGLTPGERRSLPLYLDKYRADPPAVTTPPSQPIEPASAIG